MAEGKRATIAGIPMRSAEGFRAGPRLESSARLPQRGRGVEHMVVAPCPIEQVPDPCDDCDYGLTCLAVES